MNELFPDAGELYPLAFAPIFKERIWGGPMMREVLHRETPASASGTPVGESWEISDRTDAESVVTNGPLAGRTLHELLLRYREALVGRQWRGGNAFPLLVKLIDAGERLSLQVHPDAAACAALGGGAEPKTEMWYVVAARRGAAILAGLNRRATKQLVREKVASPEIEALLQNYESHPGDAYFITAGTPHAIGAGNLILEIQQNSDTTYRLSDWGRTDAAGRSRELHIEQGMQSIHFTNRATPRIAGVVGTANHNRKFDVVTMCPFFSVSDLRLVDAWNDDTGGRSFHIVSAVNGPVAVSRFGVPEAARLRLAPGSSALIPAVCGSYTIEPLSPGETTVLRTTL